MAEQLSFYIILVVAMLLLIMLANKIKVAYPILLVVAGLLISFIPGIPVLRINPELILIIFLPPILYEAAWAISWKELWHWRRIITSFAFIVVFITALSVALVSYAFIPGFTLALGFLLGGIVSPPDAVSANAILRFVKLPKALSSILEGESLLNDASSLIIFQFAVIAIATGQFEWYHAASSFLWMVIGGVGIGLLVGWLFMKGHQFLPTDSRMDIVLTFVAPYVMYLAAEEAHSSGILAVVSGGLLLSAKRHVFLSSTSRLQGIGVWESLIFVLNGLIFLMIGLDLPEITSGLQGMSLSAAVGYGLLISAVLIVGRIIIAYGAVAFTMIAKHFITVADTRNPGLKTPFILGWAGMRGVVSLAAALSIPLYLSDGSIFPQRNLILFITFVVILTTLIVQGLTLPFIIRAFKLENRYNPLSDEETEKQIKKELAAYTFDYVNNQYPEVLQNSSFLQQLADRWKSKVESTDKVIIPEKVKPIYLDILNRQRQWLLEKNHSDVHLDENIIRRHLYQIDVEETRLQSLLK
ncbi:MAG: Na+/H+ antiporter [Cytophagales bacterium]|jgi:CPA1 family monovalent cation:H+ antiporter|nr:Na+/H+ antiporter [Bacteroidota bacterium]MBS1982489.1 Na+/H+ antiporter [Bacteroidota bacterium]WHZ06351.1 MAG: Na+/H+ antiporter [Cytophagales bacterium]